MWVRFPSSALKGPVNAGFFDSKLNNFERRLLKFRQILYTKARKLQKTLNNKEDNYEHKRTSDYFKKGKYYISKHRFYELKHFCLQYHEWEAGIMSIDIMHSQSISGMPRNMVMDPVGDYIAKRSIYIDRIRMVDEAIRQLNDAVGIYIFRAVVDGVSFGAFEAEGIPCGRDYYYDRYRQFFYILDKIRV